MSAIQVNGILKRIQLSSDPISLIRSLKESGICLKALNFHAEFRSVLCDLIRRSYGLGLKVLIDCELDLTIHDPCTGDSPLMLVCMEGLCGPTKKLIEHLPWPSLLHANTSGLTPLKYLLTRGHGQCGCIEKFLSHVPLSVLILPESLLPLPTLTTQLDELNASWMATKGKVRNGPPVTSSIIVSIEHNANNVILMPLYNLLDRIQSQDPKRLISVVQLWMSANLILLPSTTKPILYERNLRTLSKLLHAILFNQTPGKQLVDRLLHLLHRLIILDQLDVHTVWFQLHEILIEQGLAEDSGYLCQSIRFAANMSGVPLPLRSLVVRQLRQLFQQRFIQACLSNPNQCEQNALIFIQWVKQLPVPQIVISHILLVPIDFSDLS